MTRRSDRRARDKLAAAARDVLARSEAARLETEQMIAEVKDLVVQLKGFSEALRIRAKDSDHAQQ